MKRDRTLTPDPSRFKRFRKRLGLSQSALVHLARERYRRRESDTLFSLATVKRIERGRPVFLDVLRAAAHALGVEVVDVLASETESEAS